MPRIAISGSQGQGKSTVLASLNELGYNIIPQKTSRSILSEWDMSLNDINMNLELTKNFQEEILVRHIKNCDVDNTGLYFSERSFADIFAYTVFALGSFNEYNTWLDEYYTKCKNAQANVYDAVFYLTGRTDVEDDGVRAANKQFSKSIDLIIKHYLDDFGVPVITISGTTHNERIEQITKLL